MQYVERNMVKWLIFRARKSNMRLVCAKLHNSRGQNVNNVGQGWVMTQAITKLIASNTITITQLHLLLKLVPYEGLPSHHGKISVPCVVSGWILMVRSLNWMTAKSLMSVQHEWDILLRSYSGDLMNHGGRCSIFVNT